MRIKENFGLTFPVMFIVVAVLLIIFGIVLISTPDKVEIAVSPSARPIAGIVAFIAGAFILSSYEGVEIDLEKKKLRKFSSSLGLKWGKWRDLNPYKYLAITSTNVAYNMNMRGALPSQFSDQVFTIVLLNDNHLSKFVIQQADSLSAAKSKIKELSDKLGFEIVEYKPKKISKRKRR